MPHAEIAEVLGRKGGGEALARRAREHARAPDPLDADQVEQRRVT